MKKKKAMRQIRSCPLCGERWAAPGIDSLYEHLKYYHENDVRSLMLNVAYLACMYLNKGVKR